MIIGADTKTSSCSRKLHYQKRMSGIWSAATALKNYGSSLYILQQANGEMLKRCGYSRCPVSESVDRDDIPAALTLHQFAKTLYEKF